MIDDDDRNDSTGGDKVGYGRPPRHTRFKPGQSGNPKGKAKGVHNVATDVRRALNAAVRVSADGKPRKMSARQGVIMRVMERALKGDARFAGHAINLMERYDGEAHAPQNIQTHADDQAILDAMERDILENNRVARSAGKQKRGS
jgi:hypothetical protein